MKNFDTIEEGVRRTSKHVWDIYKCKLCGREFEHRRDSMRYKKSCGCKRPAHFVGEESAWRRYYSDYRQGSKSRSRDYEFSITLEEFVEEVQKPCNYCGEETRELVKYYNRATKVSKTNTSNLEYLKIKANGLDRVDNSVGYIKSNIVACCATCNRMKWALGKEEFYTHIEKILKHKGDN
jgi:hypothetical protein